MPVDETQIMSESYAWTSIIRPKNVTAREMRFMARWSAGAGYVKSC